MTNHNDTDEKINASGGRKGAKNFEHFYRSLFASTFLISAFTVGGGFVIIPLLRAKYVDEYGWLTDEETLNLVAIAQSMPGAVAINATVLMGFRMRGLPGALTAMVATVLPPLITISLITLAYAAFADNPIIQFILKGMQCGATALIINVAIDLIRKQIKKRLVLPLMIILATFIANFALGISIMYLILIDGIIGLLLMRDKIYS